MVQYSPDGQEIEVSFHGLEHPGTKRETFAAGVELGRITERILNTTEDAAEFIVHSENREVFSRVAMAYGWVALFRECGCDGFLTMRLARGGKSKTKNPVGLRVVGSDNLQVDQNGKLLSFVLPNDTGDGDVFAPGAWRFPGDDREPA